MSYNQDYEPVTTDELAQYDESMGEAEVQERRSAPDGSYQVEVERAILTRTKSSAEPMLKWQLDIIGPTHIGSKLFKNHLFSSLQPVVSENGPPCDGIRGSGSLGDSRPARSTDRHPSERAETHQRRQRKRLHQQPDR